MTVNGVGRNVAVSPTGGIQCTSCHNWFLLEDFPFRTVRMKKVRSRWCRECNRSYQQDYYNATGVLRHNGQHGHRIPVDIFRAVVADTRKGLAIAMDYKLSLSTVYKIKSAARKLSASCLTNSKIDGKLEKQSNLNKQGIQNVPDQNPT